jgi:hypothetical protein
MTDTNFRVLNNIPATQLYDGLAVAGLNGLAMRSANVTLSAASPVLAFRLNPGDVILSATAVVNTAVSLGVASVISVGMAPTSTGAVGDQLLTSTSNTTQNSNVALGAGTKPAPYIVQGTAPFLVVSVPTAGTVNAGSVIVSVLVSNQRNA